ncbi:MAG: DNRLRE domain-containing protein [Planctomycetota bacterium]|jgi:hypothetical protein
MIPVVFILIFSHPAGADTRFTVSIRAEADNTIIQHPDGDLSNGSGPVFFSGRTGQSQYSIRRAVISFDIAGSIPSNAVVESVSLTLYLVRGNGGDRRIRLHRLLADWGEGGSFTSGGSGAPAAKGDATWIHTFFPDSLWHRIGGLHTGRVSTVQEVGDIPGYYTWDTAREIVQDVQNWLRRPERNFGWILIGDERESSTVKKFSSRENPDETLHPMLHVTYTVPEK